MLVYHGTLKENAESIITQKTIKTTNGTNTQYSHDGYSKTTYGYVYLSKSINEALGFALLSSKNKVKNHKQEIAIFEIDIDEDEYEIDMDEKRYNAMVTQIELPENSSLRVSRDLIFGTDIKKYCLLSFSDYEKGCKYADNSNLDSIIEDKWITI